jgi:hypothetical protein
MTGEVVEKRSMSMATAVLALLCVAAVVYVFARGRQGSPATATPTKDASAPPAPEGYLQLKLALYNRKGLVLRVHLRFAAGDNSYNYIRAGQAYIGLFHDPELAAKATALVRRECKKLSAVLTQTTLAEAELRPEDSAAFMGKLVRGEAFTENFKSGDSIAKLSISCAEPQGTAWKGEREFKSEGELDSEYGPLIAECTSIGNEAAAFAAAGSK